MRIERILKFETERDPEFAKWVARSVGGERIRHCLQCGLCSGTCPLSLYMDYTPRRLMHLSREGFKEEVLSSLSIWLCTCCYACMVECPKTINITHLMYALKERAVREHYYPKHFSIPVMALAFAKMVRQKGRVTETWLMMRVILRTAIMRAFGMRKMGMKLMRTGRMVLTSDHIHNRPELVKILDSVEESKRGMAL
jgi:heterodisulfide reductase subunit C